MIKTIFKTTLITLIVLAILATNVLAIPGMSHKFYGSVTLNGQPAPDGTTVTAKINDVIVASTTTSEGKFGYPLYSFGVDDPDNDRAGKEIKFFVNDIDTGQTINFCNACYNLCDMYTPDCALLSFSVSTGSTQPPSGGGGGGGGIGGGGTSIPPTEEEEEVIEEAACQEEWTCSDWSDCQDDIQTRTCTDANDCGTRNNEPFTTQPCSAEEREEATQTTDITGFLFLSPTDWLIGIVAGIIIASVVILAMRRRKKKR